MKKSLLLATLFALCALLVSGSFSNSGYAKGAKKKPVRVEKTVAKSTTSKETSASTKSSATKSSAKAKTKSSATTKVKSNTPAGLNAGDQLLKAHGTSQGEIRAMIEQASVAKTTSSAPAAGEEINWQVLSGGGGSGSSTNFGLISVIGQTAVGLGSSTNFNVNHGFLQAFGSAGCCVTAGDYTDDGTFNIADVTAGIARIFTPGSPPPSCQDQADFNSDGAFNIADVTAGIARIFTPGSPAPICGTTGA